MQLDQLETETHADTEHYPSEKLTTSIFADRGHVRAEIRDDAKMAGFQLAESGTLDDILHRDDHRPVDLIVLDCMGLDRDLCEAIRAFDQNLCDTSRRVIVSTNMGSLDQVYACFALSNPYILVSTGRAERMLALSRFAMEANDNRVRELSEEERRSFDLMSEQITGMAIKLDSLIAQRDGGRDGMRDGARYGAHDGGRDGESSAFNLQSPRGEFRGEQETHRSDRLVTSGRPSLPDPRLVRRIIRQRQTRAKFFDAELFADPAWDMLLDLTAARAEHIRVSVTSLCIAAAVPPTTALRWISQMVEAGLLERVEDESDKRRAFIALSDSAADGMARYFAELANDGAAVV